MEAPSASRAENSAADSFSCDSTASRRRLSSRVNRRRRIPRRRLRASRISRDNCSTVAAIPLRLSFRSSSLCVSAVARSVRRSWSARSAVRRSLNSRLFMRSSPALMLGAYDPLRVDSPWANVEAETFYYRQLTSPATKCRHPYHRESQEDGRVND
jgi:hypothetical protein